MVPIKQRFSTQMFIPDEESSSQLDTDGTSSAGGFGFQFDNKLRYTDGQVPSVMTASKDFSACNQIIE